MGSRGLKQWVVTSISHMGQMRDSDWSRRNLLRSDWLLPRVALCTTIAVKAYIKKTLTEEVHQANVIIKNLQGNYEVNNG